MKRIAVVLLVCVHFISFSQEEGQKEVKHLQKLSFIMGYSLIDNPFAFYNDEILIVPTFGINYDFFFTKKWGAGLHTDIVLQQYTVESHADTGILIRDNPIAVCGVIIFKPVHYWSIIGGFGMEYERHKNLPLIRFGVEYEVPIRNNWEVSFSTDIDIKFNAYSSFIFGIGFTKLFGK